MWVRVPPLAQFRRAGTRVFYPEPVEGQKLVFFTGRESSSLSRGTGDGSITLRSPAKRDEVGTPSLGTLGKITFGSYFSKIRTYMVVKHNRSVHLFLIIVVIIFSIYSFIWIYNNKKRNTLLIHERTSTSDEFFSLDDQTALYYLDQMGSGKYLRYALTFRKTGEPDKTTYISKDTRISLGGFIGKSVVVSGEWIYEEQYVQCVMAPCPQIKVKVLRLTQISVRFLRVCPEQWYGDRMPSIIGSERTNNEYFIYQGKRRELSEFDINWVKTNCQIKPVYAY